jgi:hypothetical protein
VRQKTTTLGKAPGRQKMFAVLGKNTGLKTLPAADRRPLQKAEKNGG